MSERQPQSPATLDPSSARGRGRPRAGLVLAVVAAVSLPVAFAATALVALGRCPDAFDGGRQTQSIEARANLELLGEMVASYCRAHRRLPEAAGPVPARPTAERARAPFAADPGFAALGFAPREPVRYAYSVEPSGPEGLRIVARGDLDGDGVLSELSLACQLEGCVCAPRLVVLEELE